MIADMIQNKKLNSIVSELFIRRRKLNIYLNNYLFFYSRKEIFFYKSVHVFIEIFFIFARKFFFYKSVPA